MRDDMVQVADRAMEDLIAVLMAHGLMLTPVQERAARDVVVDVIDEVVRAVTPATKAGP